MAYLSEGRFKGFAYLSYTGIDRRIYHHIESCLYNCRLNFIHVGDCWNCWNKVNKFYLLTCGWLILFAKIGPKLNEKLTSWGELDEVT